MTASQMIFSFFLFHVKLLHRGVHTVSLRFHYGNFNFYRHNS